MTALPNKCYSGCHKATEEEDDRETSGKEIWRGKCGQRASGLAGGRWRRQHRIELAYSPLEVTRHNRCQVQYFTCYIVMICDIFLDKQN